MSQERILVIEDEPDIGELIEYNLTREGFRVSVRAGIGAPAPAVTPTSTLELARATRYAGSPPQLDGSPGAFLPPSG